MKFKEIKQLWKEHRKFYLDQAHTKESEVRRDHWGNQIFLLDGHYIYMPEHLMNTNKFKIYLDKEYNVNGNLET